jgi:hypothetical protein
MPRPQPFPAPADPDPQGANCFSLRRANPFLGVVAVVKIESARALSLDGLHWQIQVLAHPPRGLWSGDGDSDLLKYFRFGVWTADSGLRRVPLNPILDLGHMLRVTDALVAQIAANLNRIPFPLAPEFEQWLLDAEGVPLALLATAQGEADLADVTASEWIAGGRGDRQFVSPTLAARSADRLAPIDALERLVREAAGRPRQAPWFRQEGGVLVGLGPERAGQRLPVAGLPPLTIRTDWPGEREAGLVADYIDWLSPYLLTLPGLSEDTRRRLEASAVRHALVVDDLWRLYPQVLDPGLVAQARVEARLRRANV